MHTVSATLKTPSTMSLILNRFAVKRWELHLVTFTAAIRKRGKRKIKGLSLSLSRLCSIGRSEIATVSISVSEAERA